MSKPQAILGLIAYIVAFSVFCSYFFIDLNGAIYLSPIERIIFLLTTSIAMYIGGFLLTRSKLPFLHINLYQANLVLWFIMYIFLIITLTQLDPYSYRDDFGKYILYESRPLNLVPFNTITTYTTNYFAGYIPLNSFLYNIIGNIVALMPLAFFLPLLFKRQNNFLRFFLTVFATTLIIEITQFITMSGTCDIDDIILNLAGACVAYLIAQLKPVKACLKRLFLPTPSELPNTNNPINEV